MWLYVCALISSGYSISDHDAHVQNTVFDFADNDCVTAIYRYEQIPASTTAIARCIHCVLIDIGDVNDDQDVYRNDK